MLAGGYEGPLYAVNPRHGTILGRPSYASLAAIGAPVELAIIATPPHAVADVLRSAKPAKLEVAVVMTAPGGVSTDAVAAWTEEVGAAARASRVRVVGAGALGIIRPEAKLNATYCAPTALPGRLGLIAQSGAVATAMLDFASPLGIGFSTVISLGGGMDVGFGELLDMLLLDAATDGILLYVEEVGDARAFMSALRAAARTKPVVVLKSGRSLEPPLGIAPDAGFTAAMMRAGSVRVQKYTQLFAAALILARGRIPQGNRVAIVSNGRGPALLAADNAADRGIALAQFTRDTIARLDALLADGAPRVDPIDVRDAPPERHAAAVRIALDDPNVDAVVALHVPRPSAPALQAAQALSDAVRTHAKPVLAGWLGAIDRREVHAALEAGGVPNFYTPESAIDAVSFLAAYRNNQAWLLEVPPPQPEPEPLDLAPVEALRLALADAERTTLTRGEAARLLAAFGLVRYAIADSLDAASKAAADLPFPLALEIDDAAAPSDRRIVGSRRSLRKAWQEVATRDRAASPTAVRPVVLRPAPRDAAAPAITLGITTDRRFGPVIFAGPASGRSIATRQALMLPPLNARLAADLIAHTIPGSVGSMDARVLEALVDALTRLSALACALPWVRTLLLDPVQIDGGKLYVGAVRAAIEPRDKLLRGYPHMAIHPYPVELIGDVSLADGTRLHVRPIRPEDAALERAFVSGLSEQTRYYRFFYRLAELSPAMLARFTQVDYDRELALVALAPDSEGEPAFVGVARYIANPDCTSAEFAVVVADAWQRRGVARVLMHGLIVCAKRRGFEQLSGTVLRVNEPMLAFVRALGFHIDDDPEDSAQVYVTLPLA
jgi:acetyltransferase